MNRRLKNIIAGIAILASVCAYGGVYDDVNESLNKLPNRLLGTKNFDVAIDIVEQALKKNGIETHHQHFPTKVPYIKDVYFKVNGQNIPVNPLGPNNLMNVSTGKNSIKGKLKYLGTGDLNNVKSEDIKNRIILLDWGSPNMRKIFSEGASAIVFVGNDKVTKWDVAKCFSQFNLTRPLFYISKQTADKYKLLEENASTYDAELKANVLWKKVMGENLWAVIAPSNQTIFELKVPEVVVLTARLDSFGVIPWNVKGSRDAANCALLVDLASQLAKKKLDRSVLLVFHSSAYNVFEGLRNFYYPLYKTVKPGVYSLEDRKNSYKEELSKIEKLLEVINTKPIVAKEDNYQFEIRMKIKEEIIRIDNSVNFKIAAVNEKLYSDSENQELLAKKKSLKVYKKTVTELRRQVNERFIEEKSKKLFAELLVTVKKDINARKNQLQDRLLANKDYLEISNFVKGKSVIDAYNFDFSNDDMPFTFAARAFEIIFIQQQMELGYYDFFYKTVRELCKNLNMQNTEAPLLIDSLTSNYTPIALTSRKTTFLASVASLTNVIPGFNFRNVPGNYDYDELPGDFKYNLKGLTKTLPEFMDVLINSPKLSLRSRLPVSPIQDDSFVYYYANNHFNKGDKFDFLARGGKELESAAKGAMMYVGPTAYDRIEAVPGYSLKAFTTINQEGYTFMPLVTMNGSWDGRVAPGNLGGIAFNKETGRVNYYSSPANPQRLFYCYGGAYSFLFAPSNYAQVGGPALMKGKNNGSYFNSISGTALNPGDGILYVDKNMLTKINIWDTLILGPNNKKSKGEGIGVSVEPEKLLNMNTIRESAKSYLELNNFRLSKLHKKNIFNDSIESLQDKAEIHIKEAEKAREGGKVEYARAHETFAQTLAFKAYAPLKQLIDDMVTGVLILLLLCIPFSFALERLLLGCTSIYKQLAGFAGFFIATFVVLFFLHPAFAIAQAPLMIFIAFIIIILSVTVIHIVMGRFKSELLALQGLDTSAHRVSSENSTVLAAVLIGVSSMRNRPLKTFLTILTVILLTFTIISFASFNNETGVSKTYLGSGEGEPRIELFQPSHLNIPLSVCNSIKNLYSKKYDVVFRSASFYNPFYTLPYTPEDENLLYNPKNMKFLKLDSVIGFQKGEYKNSNRLKEVMPGYDTYNQDDAPPIYLSDVVVNDLELKKGQILYLRGIKVKFVDTFNSSHLNDFTFLDGSKTIPPDFKATSQAENQKTSDLTQLSNIETVDSSSFIWGSPTLAALTNSDTALALHGCVNSVILYPKTLNADIASDANELAEVFQGMAYTLNASGVNKYFYTYNMSAKGLSNIFVPLALGALIIFSSLLGSIADREREIFTFSALGLGPFDVSVLFLAESSVYAVIGGLGGYLFSQFAGFILNILATYGIFQAPEMNYSSLSTVYTILIVMGIVILSTLYPAFKASRAANPGVQRKWKMPKPENGKLKFPFPFTVSNLDMGGILVFISEHFENHSDASIGSFTASDIEIFKPEGSRDNAKTYGLSAVINLAPFDLGVSQKFIMFSQPSNIPGIDEIIIELEKFGGSDPAWLRGNRRFLDEIRNQFLLWRSIPLETVVHYRTLAENKITLQ
jgi:ABC-type antimicrobial peptide transport system permease subunit